MHIFSNASFSVILASMENLSYLTSQVSDTVTVNSSLPTAYCHLYVGSVFKEDHIDVLIKKIISIFKKKYFGRHAANTHSVNMNIS